MNETNGLILQFPVLQHDSVVFNEDVSYCVTTKHENEKLTITHKLTGKSFIRQLIEDKKATFSVSLYYKNSRERQSHTADGFSLEDNAITLVQTIENSFSYAPEISASIIIFEGLEEKSVGSLPGLSNFWPKNQTISIPRYARIAYHPTRNFDTGNIESLIHVEIEKDYESGVLKVTVNATAGEGEKPITVLCAQDVYNELSQIKKGFKPEEILDSKNAIGSAIFTHILCAVYSDSDLASMKNDETNEMHNGLSQHLRQLEEKTKEDWESDDFNPSLAATKMLPYAIKALKNLDFDDD